ncbi:hypothetical protein I317_03773 [Kwoniella heveanensis CBS 569]|uniref:Pentatricopeptide repeat protein n=1 Tax=Kwoniella heveanensis BCC8398 TaxID=1296120 RepID=A0A1B9GUJ8_9TREE|nr:hypothetical protein I316_03741 [Kwoniella heveanensis BCC8398]OCF42398.1 hypothetical protein I317_03773 [Kwoniella heveanensis CBS 569]
MLTKATAHFRPFIRLPSSSGASPDHFTANPSLLHHLPHNGSGNSLVAQTQSSTQTAGGSGPGRHGYGGNAGAGGSGYTGHARAFLSLPQTASVDPSSTLSNSDDNRLDNASSSQQRSNMLLKHRLSKRTRIIGPSDGVGREVRREIEGRTGGRQVSVLEIEGGEEADWKEEKLALPSPIRPSTPTRQRDALSRSQTTVELWQVGIPRARVPIGLRSLSTRSDVPHGLEDAEVPRPFVTSAPIPATRILGQPNRVLMDLAGRDLPGKRLGLVRRNSTAAVERASLDHVPVEAVLKPSSARGTPKTKAETDPREHPIHAALMSAREDNNVALVERLVQHYRSPRSVSPFAQEQAVGDPALAEKYPLPEGYSLRVYNACLGALHGTRQAGQSIAPILEIYNEMLERDLIPNAQTYSFVIRALATRAIEVSNAVSAWEEQKQWGQWRAQLVGKDTWNVQAAAEKDELFRSYEAEGNLASALKLFRASARIHAAEGFTLPLYGTLLQAMSKESQPDVQGMIQIYQLARRHSVAGRISLYRWIFHAIGVSKNPSGLPESWKAFIDRAETAAGEEDWTAAIGLGVAQKSAPEEVARRVEGIRRETWESAILAFIAVGQPEKGFEIFSDMIKTAEESPSITNVDYTRAPPADHRTCGELVVFLAQAGYYDLAVEWINKIESTGFLNKCPVQRFALEHISRIVDALLLADRPDQAFDTLMKLTNYYSEFTTSASRTTFARRLWRIYTAFLARCEQSTGAERTAALDKIQAVGRAGRFPLDPRTVGTHLSLLTEAGRFDELASVFDMCDAPVTERHEVLVQLNSALAVTATSAIPLRPLLQLVKSAGKHGSTVDARLAQLTVSKYLSERGSVSSQSGRQSDLSPETSFVLLEIFESLPVQSVSEGDFDDALLALVEDLVALNGNNSTDEHFLAQLSRNPAVSSFIAALVHRFGVERSTQSLSPLFGEEEAQRLATTSTASTFSSAPSPSGSSNASQSSASSSPSSATSASTSGHSGRKYRIDKALTTAVERFTQRNPPITPLQAYDLVKQGLTRNAVPYPNTLCQLIDHLARAGDEAKVQELYALAQVILSTINRPESQARNWQSVEDAMLIASCHLGHLEQAGMHRARIVEAGMAPSADAYATMIASSKDTTDDALVARELFDESQAMGVKPHLYLYNTIISKLSKARKAETALELFKHMKAAGIRPSSVTYGAVINACCRVGDAQSAETLFEEMASQPNFRARVPPFNTMMQFYLQTQPNRDRVLYYYNALLTAQVQPSAHTYKLLLDTYATLAPIDLEAMENVFAEIQSNPSVSLQGTHWASLIMAYGLHANDLSKAKEIFDKVPANNTREAVVWEAMLNVLSQKGTVDELESVRQKMISTGVQPTAYVYNALINGYSRSNDIVKARELFESMGDSVSGVAAPNNHPTLLTSSGHVKPNTVTDGPTRVVYREPSTYEAMIRAEVRAGDRSRAEEVLARMEERGYPVAVYMRGRAALDEIQ